MQSRRDVLRMGGSVGGAGLLTWIAGCSDIPGTGGNVGDLDYTEWTYDPETLDSNSVSVRLVNVARLLEVDEVTDKDAIRDGVTTNYGAELSAADIQFSLGVGSAEILTGTFNGNEIVGGMGLSEEGSYGDFDLYANDEEENELVATDGAYLVNSNHFDSRTEIELLIDTYNDDADRFVGVSDDFELVRDTLGTGLFSYINGLTESAIEDAEDDRTVMTGRTAAINGKNALGTHLLVFKSTDGVDLDEVQSNIELLNLPKSADVDDVSQDGRVVAVEFTQPTAML